jgi:hypothetical protein
MDGNRFYVFNDWAILTQFLRKRRIRSKILITFASERKEHIGAL